MYAASSVCNKNNSVTLFLHDSDFSSIRIICFVKTNYWILPQGLYLGDLGWGLRTCISNKFSDDADVMWPPNHTFRTTALERNPGVGLLCYRICICSTGPSTPSSLCLSTKSQIHLQLFLIILTHSFLTIEAECFLEYI